MTHVKKYEFTEETVYLNYGDEGSLMHRIRALIDIPSIKVKAGDLGGFIESESCLSHFGNAWVADESMVHDSSCVSGDTLVKDRAVIYMNCFVHGKVVISGSAKLYSTKFQGVECEVKDNAVLQQCDLNGVRVTIQGFASLQRVRNNERLMFSSFSDDVQITMELHRLDTYTFIEGEQIHITGKAVLKDVSAIRGKYIGINDNCFLEACSIQGDWVFLHDACSVEPNVKLEENIRLNEMVTIKSKSGKAFSNITLKGDGIYYAEALTGA